MAPFDGYRFFMTPEALISEDIKRAIGSQPDLLLLRNTVGMHHMPDEARNQVRNVRHGLGNGSPDFVCILRDSRGIGVWFCLEVKAPGKDPTPDQEKCKRIWSMFGAMIYTVRSAEEAVEALNEARKKIAILNA